MITRQRFERHLAYASVLLFAVATSATLYGF